MLPDINVELKAYDLIRFPLIESAYLYENKTLAHTFFTVIAPSHEGHEYVAIMSKDSFDSELACAVFAFATANPRLFDHQKAITIVSGFQHVPYRFDCIAAISPIGHDLFETINPTVSKHTFIVFPAFRFEFSGNESPVQVDLIRHDFVATLDWGRPGTPYAYARFDDKTTGIRTAAKKWVPIRFSFLEQILKALPCSEGGFIELANFKGQSCRIIVDTDVYQVFRPNHKEPIEISGLAIVQWTKNFLVNCL